jgi:hypothetical protein
MFKSSLIYKDVSRRRSGMPDNLPVMRICGGGKNDENEPTCDRIIQSTRKSCD